MGIGTDKVKQLDGEVAGLTVVEMRAAYAELVNAGNERLMAIDLGDVDAKHAFAESNPEAFEIVRAAEVSKKLAQIEKPRAESIDAALEAEVAKR